MALLGPGENLEKFALFDFFASFALKSTTARMQLFSEEIASQRTLEMTWLRLFFWYNFKP